MWIQSATNSHTWEEGNDWTHVDTVCNGLSHGKEQLKERAANNHNSYDNKHQIHMKLPEDRTLTRLPSRSESESGFDSWASYVPCAAGGEEGSCSIGCGSGISSLMAHQTYTLGRHSCRIGPSILTTAWKPLLVLVDFLRCLSRFMMSWFRTKYKCNIISEHVTC